MPVVRNPEHLGIAFEFYQHPKKGSWRYDGWFVASLHEFGIGFRGVATRNNFGIDLQVLWFNFQFGYYRYQGRV